MSNTSTGINTMSKPATPAQNVKKVSKKSDAVPVAASAPVADPAAAPAAKKSKPAVAATATAAAPVATAVVDAVAVEVKSVEQEIAALVTLHQTLRDQAACSISSFYP